jgi:hypothetical protein
MKFRKVAQKFGAVVAGGALMATQAHAALSTEITDALTAAKTDGLAVAGGFILAIIVISALLVARRGAKG